MTIKVRPVGPLLHNVPIVDAGGRPTAQFSRLWMQARTVDEAVGVTAESLGGLETGFDEHIAATTDVHGIADTGQLILEGDVRLSNARTPLAHAASHAGGGTDPLLLVNLGGDLPVARVTDAVATNDPRLSDARAPAAHAATHQSGGTDVLALVNLSGDLPVARVTDAVATTDPRLSNSRTPTAHAASHQAGGSDELSLAWAQVSKFGAFPSDIGAAASDHTHNWFQVSKAGAVPSDIGAAAELHVHSAADITSGTLDVLRLSSDVVLQSELTAHEADTTSVHGIADTSQLVLKNTSNTFIAAQTISAATGLLTIASTTASAAGNAYAEFRDGVGMVGQVGDATSSLRAMLVVGATGLSVQLRIGTSVGLELDANLNVVIGTAALATAATNGFLYIPSCAGVPTGVPTTKTGRVPIVFDTVNLKMCVYTGGSWKVSAAYT